jgi:predicted TIM-barrel fold metal-dependent hydrolase
VRVSTAWQIGELAGRHPEVTFVATSGGQINISGIALAEAETMLEEHPNVYMDTSGIYREDFIEDMAKRFGAGRILFGSAAPPLNRDLELRRAQWAHLPEEDLTLILGENARSLGFLGKSR